MYSLPGRASDAGPQGRTHCPCCSTPIVGKGSCNTIADCVFCGSACCDVCGISIDKGIVCDYCTQKMAENLEQCAIINSCPNCGSITGQPRDFDFGVDPETGYHDVGEACSECYYWRNDE